MISRIEKLLLTTTLLIIVTMVAQCQYMINPSLEGLPQPHIPPPGWDICNAATSTPDTQPGSWGVGLPPSHLTTYLGMTARDDYTWEDVQTSLINPLRVDSCYYFKIDLAYVPFVNSIAMLPITLKVYGGTGYCDKSNLIWQSPPISNEEWLTYEFLIHPETEDITNIVLEAYYQSNTAYWGYILMDHIVITRDPVVDLGQDTTLILCEEDSLVLNPGLGFASYLWSDNSTDSVLVVDTSGTYWVQVSNAYGCVAWDTIEVTIEPYVPMVTEMIDSTYVCQGQEVVVVLNIENGTEPYSIDWIGLGDTLNSVTLTADSTAFYVVNVTDNCGNSISDSVKLIVIPSPMVDLGEDMMICEGEELTLSVEGGSYFYLWQNGSTDTAITVTEPGWYWVTVSSIFGCSATDSIFIDYFPPPEVSLGNDTLFCDSISLLLDPGSNWQSYLWQDSTTEQTFEANAIGQYWVIVSDEHGCFGTDTINVGISPAVNVSLGPDTAVCSGDDFVLNPGNNFTSYLWQNGSTDPFLPVGQPGLYWVEVQDANACWGTDSIWVDFNPSPQIDLGNDTSLCFGESLELEAGGLFNSYLWQDNSTEPYFIATSSGVYSLSVSNAFNCFTSDEITISVSNPNVALGADTVLCDGDSLVLDAGNNFVNYLWQDGSTQSFFNVNAGGAYSVEVVDGMGCLASGQVTIEGLPQPFANLGDNNQLCEGQTILLKAPSGSFNYFWNGVQGDSIFEVSEAGIVHLQVSNQCGLTEDEININLYPVPIINLGPDRVLTSDQEIQLDGGDGFDAYLWQDGSQNQYYLVTQENYNPGSPYYSVEVSQGPCKNSDTVFIELFDIKIPNVFTPNGDNVNDRFRAFPESWSGIHSHHITVFNRWGEKVWESDHFDAGWDGKRNGRIVSEGTYFWQLDITYGSDNTAMSLYGSVTLLDGIR